MQHQEGNIELPRPESSTVAEASERTAGEERESMGPQVTSLLGYLRIEEAIISTQLLNINLNLIFFL